MEIVKIIGLIIASIYVFVSKMESGEEELKYIIMAIFWTLWTMAITM